MTPGMIFYAEVPSRRNRQLVADALTVAWIYAWTRVGLAIYHTVRRLESVGTTMSNAGASFSSTMDRISGDIGRVPIAGGTLRGPFSDAAGAGRSLQDAGVRQTHDVHTLAIWLVLVVAALPIG
jgi:hypothetical protein